MNPDEPCADSSRTAELRSALRRLSERIERACTAAGREPDSVTLVAVTKTRPAADVAALAALGVRDVGESRVQEALGKLAELDAVRAAGALRWHLVGRLQTNKVRQVASFAHTVHSVDRLKLAAALAGACGAAGGAALDVFVQVSLDGDPARGGVGESGLAELTDYVAGRDELRLRGLMAVPPLGSDPDREFARLRTLSEQLQQRHPEADEISAGMSSDVEAAIRNGSTYLRVGSALLGRRGPVFG